MTRDDLYNVVLEYTTGWPEHAAAIMSAVDEHIKSLTGAKPDVMRLRESVELMLNKEEKQPFITNDTLRGYRNARIQTLRSVIKLMDEL